MKTCDTQRMTEIKRDFQVIEGMPEDVDMVHLLEVMDARDAIPILRQMSRQKKPAANSALALVESGSREARLTDPDGQSSNEPV